MTVYSTLSVERTGDEGEDYCPTDVIMPIAEAEKTKSLIVHTDGRIWRLTRATALLHKLWMGVSGVHMRRQNYGKGDSVAVRFRHNAKLARKIVNGPGLEAYLSLTSLYIRLLVCALVTYFVVRSIAAYVYYLPACLSVCVCLSVCLSVTYSLVQKANS